MIDDDSDGEGQWVAPRRTRRRERWVAVVVSLAMLVPIVVSTMQAIRG